MGRSIQLSDQALRLFITISDAQPEQSDVQATLAAMAAEILRLRALLAAAIKQAGG